MPVSGPDPRRVRPRGQSNAGGRQRTKSGQQVSASHRFRARIPTLEVNRAGSICFRCHFCGSRTYNRNLWFPDRYSAVICVKKVRSGAGVDYEALSNDYVLHGIRREKSLIFERAEGSQLWDIHGKLYLDTMSGSAGPAMVGHAHPAVAEAVARQMAKLPSTNVLHDSVPVIELCARMAGIAPQGLSKTFLCVGGGEAVEAAIKFVMLVTGRNEVLSLT